MRIRCTLTLAAVVLFALTGLTGLARADTQAAPDPAPAAAAAPADKAAQEEAIPERVSALEKENVILREDLGKARLDTKSDLEELARRQAEAIARLNKQLAELQAKQDAERAAQARRNRKLWIAIGVVALGAILSD